MEREGHKSDREGWRWYGAARGDHGPPTYPLGNAVVADVVGAHCRHANERAIVVAGGRSTKVVSDDHLVLPLVQPAFAVRRDSNNVTANFVALPVDEVDELGLNHRLSRIIQSRRVFVALGPCSSLALNRAEYAVGAVGARGDRVHPVRAQRHVSDGAAVAGKLLGVGGSGPSRDAAGGGAGVLFAAFRTLLPGPLGLGTAVGVVPALGAIRRRV